MNVLSITKAKERINQLNLPKIFIDILDEKSNLFDYWRYPRWLFSDKHFIENYEDVLGGFDEVIPLCEEGDVAALIAVGIIDKKLKYLHMIYESPLSINVYNTYQGLLLPLFVFRWECEDELEDLLKLAETLKFNFVAEVNNLLLELNDKSFDERDAKIEEFHKKIDKS